MALVQKFKGVRFDPRFSIFQGSSRSGGKQRYLGNYQTEIEAAFAVNCAHLLLAPELSLPNEIPDDAIAPETREAINLRVVKLLDPNRIPRTRKERRRYA